MRFFRVVAGMTVTAAMVGAGLANAQVAGEGSDSESDEPGVPVVTDAEAPTAVPEEHPKAVPLKKSRLSRAPRVKLHSSSRCSARQL